MRIIDKRESYMTVRAGDVVVAKLGDTERYFYITIENGVGTGDVYRPVLLSHGSVWGRFEDKEKMLDAFKSSYDHVEIIDKSMVTITIE